MAIDSSALIAILLEEPLATRLSRAVVSDVRRLVSAMTALETAVVIEARKGPAGGREFDLLMHRARMEVAPFTMEHFELAREAYSKYGKGRHPAGLNLGDCCSYALARHSGEPLLFVGKDFSETDASPVPY